MSEFLGTSTTFVRLKRLRTQIPVRIMKYATTRGHLKLKGIAKAGVKNRNKGGASVCLRLSTFARVCLRLLAFSPLRLLAFVSVCLHLFACARIYVRPSLSRPPLRDTDNFRL